MSLQDRRIGRVLVVEDEPADTVLIQMAFAHAGIDVSVDFAVDGEGALESLRSPTSTHSLILLDLNLPRRNGKEILRELREDNRLNCVAVAMFTSSTNERDIAECYQLGANCYIEKPNDFGELAATLGGLYRFWMQTARLPRRV